jgi:hypothetical protein
MYPPAGFRFEPRTERGLRIMLRGMKIFGVFVGLILIMSILILNPPGFHIGLIVFSLIVVFGILISFLVMLGSWIYGIYLLYTGRREFGPVHTHYASMGFIFAAMFFLFFIVQNIIMIFLGFGFGISTLLIRASMGVISTLILSVTWIFFILALVPDNLKILLWVTLVISLAVSMASTIISTASPLLGIVSIGLWYPVLLLVSYCYFKTHQRLKRRDILPMLPAPIPLPYPPQNFNY